MEDSILTSIKKKLNVPESHTEFDLDITMHINTIFAVLHQLGIGPVNGFAIEDKSSTWDEFLGDNPTLNMVQSFIYLRVRLLFDQPTTSYNLNAIQEQAKELEWRLNTHREGLVWQAPVLPST